MDYKSGIRQITVMEAWDEKSWDVVIAVPLRYSERAINSPGGPSLPEYLRGHGLRLWARPLERHRWHSKDNTVCGQITFQESGHLMVHSLHGQIKAPSASQALPRDPYLWRNERSSGLLSFRLLWLPTTVFEDEAML